MTSRSSVADTSTALGDVARRAASFDMVPRPNGGPRRPFGFRVRKEARRRKDIAIWREAREQREARVAA